MAERAALSHVIARSNNNNKKQSQPVAGYHEQTVTQRAQEGWIAALRSEHDAPGMR